MLSSNLDFKCSLLNQKTYDIGFAFYTIRLYEYIEKFLLNDKNPLENFNTHEITSINEFRGKKQVLFYDIEGESQYFYLRHQSIHYLLPNCPHFGNSRIRWRPSCFGQEE